MDFKKHFEPRQSNFYYNRIAKISTIAIIALQTTYFIVFFSYYLIQHNSDLLYGVYASMIIISATLLLWFCLSFDQTIRTNIIMLWAHFLTCCVSAFGIAFLGWGYGFYLFVIMAIDLNYVHNFKTNFINVTISFCELVFFVYLLLFCKDSTPMIYLSDSVESWFYIMHFLFVVGTLILYANLTNISRKVVITTIENKKSILEQRSRYDFLTGILNRRGAMDYLENIFASLKSKKITSFVFCIGDLDNFKRINDTYGHNFGDIVLKETSNIINSKINMLEGVCARWGGEEFVVILPNIPLERSLEHMQTIRKSISEHTISTSAGDIVSISISFGFVYVESQVDFDELVSYADELMYIAKASGKNQIQHGMI